MKCCSTSHLNCPGLVSEVLMKKKQTKVLANLKNIVVLDCDKDALYKKVHYSSSDVIHGKPVNRNLSCGRVYGGKTNTNIVMS